MTVQIISGPNLKIYQEKMAKYLYLKHGNLTAEKGLLFCQNGWIRIRERNRPRKNIFKA
jgi:hypothetical protein